METYRWGYVNVSNSIIKKDKATQFLFQIPMKTIPSEATIDKYRLMAKNAVEAKYNELKNPFDEWSRITSYNVCYTKLLRKESFNKFKEWVLENFNFF